MARQGKVRMKHKARTKATPTGQGITYKVPPRTQEVIRKASSLYDRSAYVLDGKPDRRKEDGNIH